MSESLYEGIGVFGHVPTPEEAEAKAFVMPRHAQPEGFWAGYCCALADCGIEPSEVITILYAFSRGQFAHNVEPIFRYEIEDEEAE